MKIKDTVKDYGEVCRLGTEPHKMPIRQKAFWRGLIKVLSKGEMKDVSFTTEEIDMDRLGNDEPCLILMNHSSFTDLQIIGTVFSNRQYHIVCTNDGFVGKNTLMRKIGCIPARKFINDPVLVKDMKYCFDKLGSSVVMYPEASYSFDGTETPLPASMAKCIRLMKVPVVMVKTRGAFLRDPLYNNLQKRKVKVTAQIKYLFSREDTENKSPEEIRELLEKEFSYNHFRDQYESGTVVNEPFRADGLHRVLYKCPACGREGEMLGKGTKITCLGCNKEYELKENGKLSAKNGQTEFEFVPDWYAWERAEVRKEIERGEYLLDTDVGIKMLVDSRSIYSVGEGHLKHTKDGFELTGCDGKLHYVQSGKASYSLYSDYFWYEIGDMICIGNNSVQYYCFPKDREHAIVAKARLATEEIYKSLTKQ